MNKETIVITSAVRTPLGSLMGELSSLSAVELGAHAIQSAVQRSTVDGNEIDEVIMGCVLPAGLGQAPARQAALGAELPKSTHCTTINKVCGSGMKAVMLSHDTLLAGTTKVMVAGGMESMSNAPYLSIGARQGFRFGHTVLMDHMALDGLEDAYEKQPMGLYAEQTADDYSFSREQQDEFAIRSLTLARQATEAGAFDGEICPITVKSRKGEKLVIKDEQPYKASLEKIPNLRPAFKKDGTVTAANASSISDGAAALTLMTHTEAEKRKLTPLAHITAHSSFSHEPEKFTTAPVGAIESLLDKTGWSLQDVDLFEINEAFAVVPMATIQSLGIDKSKVNIYGGACALGHPIGASGARIIVTLISALKAQGKKRGIAAICIGGGEATAVAITLP